MEVVARLDLIDRTSIKLRRSWHFVSALFSSSMEDLAPLKQFNALPENILDLLNSVPHIVVSEAIIYVSENIFKISISVFFNSHKSYLSALEKNKFKRYK